MTNSFLKSSLVFTALLTMEFVPPTPEQAHRAIGMTDGLPPDSPAGLFARYDPAFYGKGRGENYQELFLRRSCRVLAHEIAHIFSLDHCIFFQCMMNGSNHLKESDSRPLSVCPVCLRKLRFSIGFDVVDRYRKLLLFYQKAGFDREAKCVSKRLKRVLGDEKGR